MADFDNAELLQDIRDRGSLPSADLRFTDTKLLAAATLELRDVVTALVIESQSDRMVYLSDMTVTAGLAEYRLPTRAVAGRWQSVGWKGDGDSAWTRLRQLHPEDYYLQSDTAQGPPAAFFVRDYMLHLVPMPNRTGTLRLPYYMRPNALVLPAAVGVVDSADATALTVVIAGDSVPAGFGDSGVFDVVRSTPGFETLVTSQAADISGQVMTFAVGGLESVQPGDYVCLAGQSPVAQCPVEVRALLATRAARRALKSVNEGSQAAMLDSDVAELTATAQALLSPRVDSEPKEWGDSRRGLLWGVLR